MSRARATVPAARRALLLSLPAALAGCAASMHPDFENVYHRHEVPAELVAAVRAQGGNLRATAIALGIGRKTLYRWLEAAGIELGAVRDEGEP